MFQPYTVILFYYFVNYMEDTKYTVNERSVSITTFVLSPSELYFIP